MDVPENSAPYWLVQFYWEAFRLSLEAPQLEMGVLAPPFPPCCIWSYFGDLLGLFQSVQQAWQANEIKTPLKLIHRSANKLAHVTSHSRSLSTSLSPSLPISLSLRSAGKAHSEKPQMRKMQIVCLPACPLLCLPPMPWRGVKICGRFRTWHGSMLIWLDA